MENLELAREMVAKSHERFPRVCVHYRHFVLMALRFKIEHTNFNRYLILVMLQKEVFLQLVGDFMRYVVRYPFLRRTAKSKFQHGPSLHSKPNFLLFNLSIHEAV